MALPFHWTVNTTFNPFNQTFIVLGPDGRTPVEVPLAATQSIQLQAVNRGISQGVQLGAAALLILCLFIITKRDKRRSMVFMLNALALLLVVIEGIFVCIGCTQAFNDWYRWETYYYAHTGRAQAVSIGAQLSNFFLICVLEMSLVLQVSIVCCTLEPHWRYMVNAFNISVALLCTAVNLALAVLTITWNILGVENETESQFQHLIKLAVANDALLVSSIAISSAIFCSKLGFAIHARRSMGMTQFGPMQIIFIMGCQTMFLPLIFLLIAVFVPASRMQSFVHTILACCLPLSAMWASANTTHAHIADADPHQHHMRPNGHWKPSSGKESDNSTTTTANTTSDTLIDDEISAIPVSPTKSARLVSQKDLEMQQLRDGVHVDRTYSVRSD